MLSAMAGHDPEDSPTDLGPAPDDKIDYAHQLDRNGLRGARIGIVGREELAAEPRVAALFDRAVEDLRRLGAELVEGISPPSFELLGFWAPLFQPELKAAMRTYLTTRRPSAPFKSLAELTEVLDKNAARETPFGRSDNFQSAVKAGDLDSQEYLKARDASVKARTDWIDAVMKDRRLDAFVGTAAGPAWKPDPLVPVMGFFLIMHMAAAASGCPSLTLPMGYVNGLPVGLLLYGPAWSEARLLSYAHAYEQATLHRRPPTFPPSVDPTQDPVSESNLP
jgi:amidase